MNTPDQHPESSAPVAAVAPPRPDAARVRSTDVARIVAIVAVGALLCFIVVSLASVLLTVAVAAFLAIAADPAVRFLQRRGLPRLGAVMVFSLVLVAAIVGLVALFVPPLVSESRGLAQDAPRYAQQVQDSSQYRYLDRHFHIGDKATVEIKQLPGIVTRELSSLAGTFFAGLLGTFSIVFLVVLMLLSGRDVVAGTVRVFPRLADRRWWGVVQESYRNIGNYVAGNILISIIAGSVLLVACLIVGVPGAVPLGLWMGLLDIVPIIGATIGAVPAVLVAFVTGGVADGVIIIVIELVYQQLENFALQPAIMGRAVSMSPVVVFVAILAGSQLLGIVGALLAIPVAGVIQIVVRAWLRERERTSGVHPDTHLPPIAG